VATGSDPQRILAQVRTCGRLDDTDVIFKHPPEHASGQAQAKMITRVPIGTSG